jgi:hypothetical protein
LRPLALLPPEVFAPELLVLAALPPEAPAAGFFAPSDFFAVPGAPPDGAFGLAAPPEDFALAPLGFVSPEP